MVYGVQPVREALRGRRRVHKVYVTERAAEHDVARARPRPPARRSRSARWTRSRPSPGAPTTRASPRSPIPYPYVDAFELLSGPHPLVVVLDGVTDPRNLGAIVRACDGAGADGLVLPRHGSAGVTSIVAKASAGAVEHVRIAMTTNLAELLRRTQAARPVELRRRCRGRVRPPGRST